VLRMRNVSRHKSMEVLQAYVPCSGIMHGAGHRAAASWPWHPGNPSLTGRKGWGPGTVALSSGKYDGSAADQFIEDYNFVMSKTSAQRISAG
jgi:hypothetical protein